MSGRPGDGSADDADPPADPGTDPTSDPSASSVRRLIGWSKANATTIQQRAQHELDAHRHRAPVDLALRVYERDHSSAGTVVGSAIAFRLFLFFVPMLLFVVGLAGFISSWIGREEVADAGITGSLATQINQALSQPNSTRWIATILGLVGMVTAGRTLSKVMVAASCLAWQMPVRTKATIRAIGATIGLFVGIGLVSTLVNKVRQEYGIGAAGISLLAAVAIYAVVWVLLSLMLPRGTSDPGVLLPGAVLVAATLAGMQALSQLYLPGQFSKASQLYGAVGVAIVTLGWFFIMGRVIMLSLTIDAVVFERFGSISTFVFGLPVLRALPRRWPRFRRFFQLSEGEGTPSADEQSPTVD